MMNYQRMLQYMDLSRTQEFSNQVVGRVQEITAPPATSVVPKNPMPPYKASDPDSSRILC